MSLAVLLVLVGTLAIIVLWRQIRRLEMRNRDVKESWRAQYRETLKEMGR